MMTSNNKFVTKVGQVYFFVVLAQLLLTLPLDFLFTAPIRFVQQNLLGYQSVYEGFGYWLLKPFIALAYKVNGVRVEVSKPVS